MAVNSTHPPQAYTRDTLVKAIEWLSQQPEAVRERAKSADIIVSFYLQSLKRGGSAIADAPVSQEAFKADLRNLAQDLKFFEDPAQPPHQIATTAGPTAAHRVSADTWVIDARSMAIAREVQQRLNLSHETEAIRFLITLGAERARSLFP